MPSPKEHQRANTYEGPQMNFKFPSEEDLERSMVTEPEALLEGPKVTPFIVSQRARSPTNDDSPLNRPQHTEEAVHRQTRSNASNSQDDPESTHSKYSVTSSHSYSFSFGNSNTSSEGTIPTQSNATTQITHNTQSLFAPPDDAPSRSGTVVRNRRPQSPVTRIQQGGSGAGSIRRTSSTAQRRHLAESALRAQREGSITRRGSLKRLPITNRAISSGSDQEDTSLYERGSIKRSKAIRYTTGWLTRIKQLGSKMMKGIKRWRLVSFKKVFKFNKSRSTRVKKNKISMPLERDRAQSISELRRAIDDWKPSDRTVLNAVPLPPTQQLSNILSSSLDIIHPMAQGPPPPPPPHRISSNKSIQRFINEQELRRASLFISGSPEQPALRDPMDQQYRTLAQQQSQEENYPSHPPTIYDDDYIGFPLEDGFDEFSDAETTGDDDDDDDDDGDDDEEEQTLMLREYWRHYLRAMVAERIETKLELYQLSQIPEPKEHHDAAKEMFGSLSDFEDGNSEYSESSNDTDSLTSISSTEISESSSSVPSQSSTNYFSTYDGPVETPLDIMKYQMEYGTRYRDIGQVKRASTLPINKEKESRHNAIEVQRQGRHMRFLSTDIN